jgi:hypothetical protein
MISATVIIMLAALAGWLLGLADHALRRSRWRDPGARLAWAAGAGIGAAGTLLASLAMCLLTRSAVFLLSIPTASSAGAIGAWRASELLRLSAPPAGRATEHAAAAQVAPSASGRARGPANTPGPTPQVVGATGAGEREPAGATASRPRAPGKGGRDERLRPPGDGARTT